MSAKRKREELIALESRADGDPTAHESFLPTAENG